MYGKFKSGHRKRPAPPPSVPRGKLRRTSAALKIQRAFRRKAVAQKRAGPIYARANRALANRNARQIAQLRNSQWGAYQTTSSGLSGLLNVTSAHPLAFHINNPHCGTEGPYMYRPNALGAIDATNVGFTQWTGVDEDSHLHRSANFKPNGPRLMLRTVDLQFKFEGFCDETRIRVDVVRQKRLPSDIFNPTEATKELFLPYTLTNFKYLAGFTQNTIDRAAYDVIATKHLYLNSKGQANTVDAAQDRNTIDGTTSTTKFCHIRLKLNKILRQLEPSMNEADGTDHMAHHPSDFARPHPSSYGWDNQHPLSNVWCIISSDDATGFLSSLTGDAVSVNVIRRVTWQDQRG